MKVLFDTSYLVALFETSHPDHDRVLNVYQRLKQNTSDFSVAAHTLSELYAVLTTLPVQPRITARQAQNLIEENIIDEMEIIELDTSDYRIIIDRLSTDHQRGGVVYDGLIARAAKKSNADRLYTLNESDFKRVWNGDPETIRVP